jgi:hypothetical protein
MHKMPGLMPFRLEKVTLSRCRYGHKITMADAVVQQLIALPSALLCRLPGNP